MQTYNTTTFNLNTLGNAVEEFAQSFKGFGTVAIVASHVDHTTGVPMGFGRSEDRGAVEMVERIAFRLEGEFSRREQRRASLIVQVQSGLISEEEYLDSFNWA